MLKEKYDQRKREITKRLEDFRDAYKKPDEDVFVELCFCLLTPQSKAKSCWRTIETLRDKGLLYSGSPEEMKKWMASVRFNDGKSKHLANARIFFTENGRINLKKRLEEQGDTRNMRAWLVDNVRGFGMKEASHFLRNIGFGDDIAILDRHILRNLVKHGVIEEIPKSITVKKYLEIEGKMKDFAALVDIPLSHLDLLFWSEETGEIFK